MNVVGLGRLAEFGMTAESGPRLAAWLAELKEAKMFNMADVTEQFPSAREKRENIVDFVFPGAVIVETMFSFASSTVLIRSARTYTPLYTWVGA